MSAQLDLFGWDVPTPPPAPGSTLLEILGDAGSTKLIRIIHKRKDNSAEMRLLAQINQLLDRSLHRFIDDLNAWMKRTSTGNQANFWLFYKVIAVDEQTVEIWHTNVGGDPDRHVCTITKPTINETL